MEYKELLSTYKSISGMDNMTIHTRYLKKIELHENFAYVIESREDAYHNEYEVSRIKVRLSLDMKEKYSKHILSAIRSRTKDNAEVKPQEDTRQRAKKYERRQATNKKTRSRK